ncbi:hypothetical protein CWE09_03650 [Aliidiomarina minuta]|uniref:Uncharacterized protein n=1 Tax=Aliidiomarina minuta TaxID=880057 RepID=A0A432W7B6_9GAMM|nr:hypothetical protein [Aliidiomarina minuta]RUO25836.1 hypothetical protein CWE09_03650 [Aliidiomarina minuta]
MDHNNDIPDEAITGASEAKQNLTPTTETTDAENNLPVILSIYWSFLWRSVAVGLLTLLIFSFILGFVLAMIDKVELAETLGGIATIVIAVPVGIWALGSALNKPHKGYSIVFSKKKEL